MKILHKLMSFILAIFALALFIAAPECLAMQMSQPVKIGEACFDQKYGALIVQGASYVSKEKMIRDKRCVEVGGVGKFGTENDALWLHRLNGRLNGNVGVFVAFGGKDIKNTFSGRANASVEGADLEIYKIPTDIGATLYAINYMSYLTDYYYIDWIILGYKDGKFVKYIDTYNITNQYFGAERNKYPNTNYYGNKNYHGRIIFDDVSPFEIKGDTIIMNYRLGNASSRNTRVLGQFRFKWDDAAKWFGVQYVPMI